MNKKIGIIIIGIVALVGINSITTVPTGHAGIKTRFRKSTK